MIHTSCRSEQAIFAWSFRQINAEQGTYFNVKSKIDPLVKKTFLKIEQGFINTFHMDSYAGDSSRALIHSVRDCITILKKTGALSSICSASICLNDQAT